MTRLFILAEPSEDRLTVAGAMERAENQPMINGKEALTKMLMASALGKMLVAETFSPTHAERLSLEQMSLIFGSENAAGETEHARQSLKLEALRLRIIADLYTLRQECVDPVDIPFGEHLSFELRPLEEGNSITIFRKGWGGTSVKYNDQDLSVVVFAEEDLKNVHEIRVASSDLATDTDNSKEVQISILKEAGYEIFGEFTSPSYCRFPAQGSFTWRSEPTRQCKEEFESLDTAVQDAWISAVAFTLSACKHSLGFGEIAVIRFGALPSLEQRKMMVAAHLKLDEVVTAA